MQADVGAVSARDLQVRPPTFDGHLGQEILTSVGSKAPLSRAGLRRQSAQVHRGRREARGHSVGSLRPGFGENAAEQ